MANGTEEPGPLPGPDPKDLANTHASLNARIEKVHEALPRGTVLIIFTGTGDPRSMAAYQAKRARLMTLSKSVPASQLPPDLFTSADERAMEDEVKKAKMGLSFFCVK